VNIPHRAGRAAARTAAALAAPANAVLPERQGTVPASG